MGQLMRVAIRSLGLAAVAAAVIGAAGPAVFSSSIGIDASGVRSVPTGQLAAPQLSMEYDGGYSGGTDGSGGCSITPGLPTLPLEMYC